MERTLGSFQEDEVLAEAAAQLQAGRMGGGADWGNSTHSHARRKSITDSGRRGSTTGGGAAGGEEVDGGAADAENSAADELGTGKRWKDCCCGRVLILLFDIPLSGHRLVLHSCLARSEFVNEVSEGCCRGHVR